MIDTRTIETTVHGRYLVQRAEGARLLVGFHGYGETAEVHLEELQRIPAVATWTVAAVQALHPFYRSNGTIVASWMTSLDRELAIADNVAYVSRVVAALGGGRPLVFAGFSQGAEMAYRAAAVIPCDGLIVLGGVLPPDVNAPAALPPILIGRGEGDEWFTAGKLKKNLSFLRDGGATVELCEFAGGHEWSDRFRQAAAEFLEEIAGRS